MNEKTHNVLVAHFEGGPIDPYPSGGGGVGRVGGVFILDFISIVAQLAPQSMANRLLLQAVHR